MNLWSARLEISGGLWNQLIADLRRRGNGCRESGAFLLGGMAQEGVRQVKGWVPYDELDRDAYSKGYVTLSTQAFSRLWAVCADRGLEVVADVHTHPEGPRQSPSDQANPMIAKAGHMALIVPNFAQGHVKPGSVSVNVYLGNHRWQNFFGRDAENLVHLQKELFLWKLMRFIA